MFSSTKSKSIVGIDIEAATVAAVEVRADAAGRVLGHGIVPLEPGIVEDGEVGDDEALGAAVKQLLAKGKLGKHVRLGVGNRRVIAYTMRLPRIEDPKDLEAAVRFRASEDLPMPLNEAILDWRQLDPADPGNPGDEIEVLLVAAHRDMIDRMIGAMRHAGARLVGIDLAAFGMVRALGSATSPGDEAEAEAGYADSGPAPARMFCNFSDSLNLAVARGRDCVFVRVATGGIETIVDDLSGRLGMSAADARQWLHHVGLTTAVDRIEGDPVVIENTREALVRGAGDLARELRISLDSYAAQDAATPVYEVVAGGPGVAISGLVEAVQVELGLPVSMVVPPALANLDSAVAARLATPYGLGREE